MRAVNKKSDFFCLSLICAVLIYAFFGSPTPDAPAWPEFIIGILLILSIGITGTWHAISVHIHAPFYFVAAQIFLLFGLTAPIINAVLQGNDIVQILRDIIPFLFLFLPIFLASRFASREQNIFWILATFCCLGVIFSLRGLENQIEIIGRFFAYAHKAELTYFANMPSVLFAGLYLPVWATRAVIKEGTLKKTAIQFISYFIAGVIFLPIIMTAQRASIAAGFVYFAIMLCAGAYYHPRQILPVLFILIVSMIPAFGFMMQVFDALYQKTIQVGVNHRFDEAAAVWESLSHSPLQMIFGKGWGGGFQSPAVGNVHVNFTHSFLTSILLKAGISGVMIALIFLGGLSQALWRCIRYDKPLGMALALPFIIDVFLYASYKSLDFGLLLLIIVIFSQKQQSAHATD